MARCKFCNQEISWIKENHRNKAIDGDGGVHACEEMKKSMKSIKKINLKEIDSETLKSYEKAINDRALSQKK